MNRASLSALALSAALFLGPVALQAQDRRPQGGGSDGGDRRPDRGDRVPEEAGRGRPGLESMTPEEREKLRAVHQRLQQNEKVRIAEAALQEASTNLRNAREEALAGFVLDDPSLEPILKKFREAGPREGEGARRRGEGDAPRRGPGDATGPRPPGEPKAGEPPPRRPERPEGERPAGPRPEAREGDRPRRPEGDRPVRPEGAREGAREEGPRPQSR